MPAKIPTTTSPTSVASLGAGNHHAHAHLSSPKANTKPGSPARPLYHRDPPQLGLPCAAASMVGSVLGRRLVFTSGIIASFIECHRWISIDVSSWCCGVSRKALMSIVSDKEQMDAEKA